MLRLMGKVTIIDNFRVSVRVRVSQLLESM